MTCAIIERFSIPLVSWLAHATLTRIKLTVKSQNQRPFKKLQTILASDGLHD